MWVRSVDNRTITLEANAPRQDIGHPGIVGLYWAEGYAQVGELVSVEGLTVTRSYRPIAGDGPPICVGPLNDCDPLALDSYAYPRDPGDRDLDFEHTSFDGPLGQLGAWVVPAGDGRRWAIHVHGWTAERREAIRLLPTFQVSSITSMVIDYRNDPDSPRDPSGHYRFGLTEWEDVEAAVSHAVEHGAAEVVLVGYSTGAAHIMSFLERSALTDRVVGIVFDAPNLIVADVVRANTMDARIPIIGLKMTQLMKEMGMWLADIFWKIDWETTNYVQRAGELLTKPTLVFHGTSDHRVPIAVSRQLEARVPEVVDLVEVQAAGHVMSWNANPKKYEDRLERHLARI